ncbi:hypothetical protein GCM10027091_16730 [Streptomyces daliensis]
MNADEVDLAFKIAATFNGTPCGQCRRRETIGVVYLGVISASCEACGGYTRKGVLTREMLAAASAASQTQPVARRANVARRQL